MRGTTSFVAAAGVLMLAVLVRVDAQGPAAGPAAGQPPAQGARGQGQGAPAGGFPCPRIVAMTLWMYSATAGTSDS